MKTMYEQPELEIIEFSVEDVMTGDSVLDEHELPPINVNQAHH